MNKFVGKFYIFLGKIFFESTAVAFLAVFINVLTSIVLNNSQIDVVEIGYDCNIWIILISSLLIFITSLYVHRKLMDYPNETKLINHIEHNVQREVIIFLILTISFITFVIDLLKVLI